jgi:hypothetical protein
MRLFDDNTYWTKIADGNAIAFSIFRRHYTFTPRKQAKNSERFAGPGQRVILLGKDHRALFVWRKEIYRLDEQVGVNCAVFRNESKILSSTLIIEAESIVWKYFPNERLFTFVNASKVKSANPGYCFKMAGWRLCGETKTHNLLILEKLP